MNKVILMGRLTKDVDCRYTQGENAMAIARYTLAVDRRIKKEGEQNADFINCVTFGKNAEFAEKYFKKGTKVVVDGRIQTGSYTKDGQTIYTTDVVIENQEFAESKKSDGFSRIDAPVEVEDAPVSNGFMNIPEGLAEELPFAQPTR